MASVQQVHNAAHLSNNEKAKVGKAIEEAKNVLANANVSQDHELVKVAGAMFNNQERGVMKYKSHNYQGDFLANPPVIIPPHGSGAFVHQGAKVPAFPGPIYMGSKAAVIYAHYVTGNQVAQGGLGWLLAWYKPATLTGGVQHPSKVYVEAGSLQRLAKLEWSEIEKKLDESVDVSRYWDSDTGAMASAKIENHGPNMALLGSNFEIKNYTSTTS